MGFPYGVKADGMTCEKFDEKTRQCTVYATRPDMCNVEKMFYIIHSKNGLTKKEAFLKEAEICNEFIAADKLDPGSKLLTKKVIIN